MILNVFWKPRSFMIGASTHVNSSAGPCDSQGRDFSQPLKIDANLIKNVVGKHAVDHQILSSILAPLWLPFGFILGAKIDQHLHSILHRVLDRFWISFLHRLGSQNAPKISPGSSSGAPLGPQVALKTAVDPLR